MNNPINYTDPSGHCVVEFAEASECTPPGILPTPYPGLPSVGPEAFLEFSPPFNLDTATITSEHRKGGHIGTDYAIDTGTKALASTMGLVVVTDWCTLDNCVDQQGNTSADANGGYGNLIIVEYGYSSLPEEVRDAYDLEEGESLYVLYGHMSSIHSRRGNVVHSSVAIGKTGSTGHSSGPHLHAEFRTGPSGQLWGSALCTTECRSASEVTPWEVWRDDLTPVDPVDAWE